MLKPQNATFSVLAIGRIFNQKIDNQFSGLAKQWTRYMCLWKLGQATIDSISKDKGRTMAETVFFPSEYNKSIFVSVGLTLPTRLPQEYDTFLIGLHA